MTYNQDTKQPVASFEEIPGKNFKDFSQVKAAIEDLTDKVCGKNKNIIDQAIILKVVSNSCPNLTVIDLPGLTRIALEGQDKDIYKVTKDMVTKYMIDPSTIILSVVPANQDITNDEVLHMAMQIDKLGERTLACITKIDIMDRGTDARNMLLNKG
jgi:vacuolar protein sorting-associated protein 1